MRTPDLARRQLRNLLMILALVALSLVCTGLLRYRMDYTGSWRYNFMTWNLLLAWVPLATAVCADGLSRARWLPVRAAVLPVAAIWLAFLPNAPYLATDLVHLSPSPIMPFWYDKLMLGLYGVTGVLIGAASMVLMKDVIARLAGAAAGSLFVSGAAVLAAFGICLGRFDRLNSWEVFSSPSLVLREIWPYFASPASYPHIFEWTVLLAAFLLASYVTLFGITEQGLRLVDQWSRRPRR
jgi:uncharacterized membrane protein